ncbi:MAG: cupin domain-containing protein [Bacteroides sp.]|nr:cupin domain-containing protein [Bacteroides sp.]
MSTSLSATQLNDDKVSDVSTKKTRSDTFISSKEKPWEPAGEGVMRQVLGYDGQVMIVKVKFEKGAIGTPHTHYHTQTTYVASGKFEFTVGNEKKIVEAGDGIYMEPDVLHSCVCIEAGMLIDCFSPMRADFLK